MQIKMQPVFIRYLEKKLIASKRCSLRHGRWNDFWQGSNSDEISFYQLETKRKTFC